MSADKAKADVSKVQAAIDKREAAKVKATKAAAKKS